MDEGAKPNEAATPHEAVAEAHAAAHKHEAKEGADEQTSGSAETAGQATESTPSAAVTRKHKAPSRAANKETLPEAAPETQLTPAEEEQLKPPPPPPAVEMPPPLEPQAAPPPPPPVIASAAPAPQPPVVAPTPPAPAAPSTATPSAAQTPAPDSAAPSTPAPASAAEVPKEWASLPTQAAPAPPPPEDEQQNRLQLATNRRGMPGLVALGAVLAILGLVVMMYTLYSGRPTATLTRFAGIRGDYIGFVLLLIGIALAATFVFVPRQRPFGLPVNASLDDIEKEVRASQASLRLAQGLVGGGIGAVAIGLLWMLWWTYVAYLEGQFRDTIIGRYAVPTHYFGGILLLVGLMVTLFFLGGVGGARRRHNVAMVLLHRVPGPEAGAPAPVAVAGVSAQDVQNLMRRLDGLMAQLPDATVTEFSKTPEADTYLKLLGN